MSEETDCWSLSCSVTTSGLVTLDRAEAVLERMEIVNVTVLLPANETAKGNATAPPPAKATGQVHDIPYMDSVSMEDQLLSLVWPFRENRQVRVGVTYRMRDSCC